MTAEVVIMNKSAVALAADSAVTIQDQFNKKIYNSANKLFTLSKYHPIGIMIYANASINGVPLETIIKMYRNKLGKKNVTGQPFEVMTGGKGGSLPVRIYSARAEINVVMGL